MPIFRTVKIFRTAVVPESPSCALNGAESRGSRPPDQLQVRAAGFAGVLETTLKFTASFTSTTMNTLTILARTVEIFDRQANGYIAGTGDNGNTILDVTTGEGQ